MTARPFFVAAIPVLAAFALALVACQGCRSLAGSGHGAAPAAGEVGPPTLRLYLLTDVAGALEPCGCTRDQLGGLDHFGAWVKRERLHAPAAMVASAGPLFFMDDRLEGERADQDRAKAEIIARVLHGLDFVAFAPGTNDWDDGPAGLARLAGASGATAIVSAAPASPPFSTVVVRDVGGVKVGFVGLGQAAPPAADATTTEAAVARGVDVAKRQGASVLVGLVAVGRGEAKRIADGVPELTAVVVGSPRARGDGNTSGSEPEQVGGVLIVQGANHLQSVVVLDLYVRESVTPGKVVRFADGTGLELSRKREDLTRRIDELHVKIADWERDPSVARADIDARRSELSRLEAERDRLNERPPPLHGSFFRYSLSEIRESLGRDPAIEDEMRSYYKAVNDHNRVVFSDRRPPPAAARQATYVGVEACTECHAPARAVWQVTAHAHAYATLSSQFKEFNLDCVGCHVTGYERPGGSTVTHVDKLRDVQCEVCHGPGSKHVSSPLDDGEIVAKPEPRACLECHHSPHVEGFDAAAKMKEILGPGHGQTSTSKQDSAPGARE